MAVDKVVIGQSHGTDDPACRLTPARRFKRARLGAIVVSTALLASGAVVVTHASTAAGEPRGREPSAQEPPDEEIRAFLKDVRSALTKELHEKLDAEINTAVQEGTKAHELQLIGYTGEIELRKDIDTGRYLEGVGLLRDVAAQNCGGLMTMWHRWIEVLVESGTVEPMRAIPEWLAECAYPNQEYDEYALVNGLTLPAVDGDSTITPIVLRSPLPLNEFPFETDYNVTLVGTLPEGRMQWYPVGDVIVIQGETALLARSKSFTFHLTHGVTQQVADFAVTLPISLGIHSNRIGGLHWILNPGDGVSDTLYASGDEVGVAGPFTWSWAPSQGGPLPTGLNLQPVLDANGAATGNLRISGAVEFGATSSIGQLRLQQGATAVTRNASFLIPVHFHPDDRAALGSVFELTREQPFTLTLPQALGGDGVTYNWSVSEGASELAARGLQLVGTGNQRAIQGTVPASAPLGPFDVELEISSTFGPSTHLTLNLNVSVPFSVWTQNSQLRPNNLVDLSTAEAAALALLRPDLATAVGVAEGIYDLKVPNSAADNEQRTDLILGHHGNFDIVALQEVFDADNLAQLSAGTGYQRTLGPPATPVDLNPFNPKLPEGSSGLALLVRGDLAVSGHQAPVFTACNGDLWDVAAAFLTFGDLNSDCLAQKGFTIDKVQFGPDATSYIYVVNTHLDAGSATGDIAARAAQLAQINSAITALGDPSHPVVIMGDLNVDGETALGAPSAEFTSMITTLGVTDLYRMAFPSSAARPGFTFDNQVNAYAFNWSDGPGSTQRSRIDYILVRQGTDYRIALDTSAPFSIAVQDNSPATNPANAFDTTLCRDPGPPVTGWLIDNPALRCYVSDHWGLEAHLRLIKP